MIKDAITDATANGGVYTNAATGDTFTLSELQTLKGKYENDFADAVQNSVLRSQEHWDALANSTNDDDLAIVDGLGDDLRIAAVKFRNELKSHLGSSYINKANEGHTSKITAESLESEDLIVTSGTALKVLGDTVKREITANVTKQTEIREKQNDSSDKK